MCNQSFCSGKLAVGFAFCSYVWVVVISYYLLKLAFQLFIFVFSFTDNSNFIETKALQTLNIYLEPADDDLGLIWDYYHFSQFEYGWEKILFFWLRHTAKMHLPGLKMKDKIAFPQGVTWAKTSQEGPCRFSSCVKLLLLIAEMTIFAVWNKS